MLKITCPNNKKHNRFMTTAHVTQDWIVNENGDYVKVLNECVQVDKLPEYGNLFTCICKTKGQICHTQAIVEEI